MANTLAKGAQRAIAIFLIICLSLWGVDFSTLPKAYADNLEAQSVSEGYEEIESIYYNNDGKMQGAYYYSDAYFDEKTGFEYNPSLATLSMQVEKASFGNAEDDYSQRPNALRKFLGEMGFSDFEANQGYLKEPTHNSIGVGIAHKEINGADGKKHSVVAVIVRGGNYGAEWGGNTHFGQLR